MKTLYHYHPTTFELLGASPTDENPMRPGEYLIPAHATDAAPPGAGDHEVAVFVDGAWALRPDYRGQQYWLPSDAHDAPAREITEIGDAPPPEALDAPPPKPLDVLKTEALAEVKAFAAGARARLAGEVDPYQAASWSNKAERARRVLANVAEEGDPAILQAESDRRGRGETPLELAGKQAAKAEILAKAVAVIDGMESKARGAVEAAKDDGALAMLLEGLKSSAEAELSKLFPVQGSTPPLEPRQ